MADPLREAIELVLIDDMDVVFAALDAVLDEIDMWGPAGEYRRGSIRQVIADAIGFNPQRAEIIPQGGGNDE